jgi:opacity protein-like surface antigen
MRMTTLRKALLAAAIVVGSAGVAAAADLHGGMKDGGYMPPIAYGPSWYARIHGMWATYSNPDMTEAGRYNLTRTSIEDNWGIGGGIGYYFSRNIRADMTYEWREKNQYRGSQLDLHGPLPGQRRFGVQSDVVLANVYYDIAPEHRISPYIGFGIGAAHHDVSAGTVIPVCGCGGTIDAASNWHVAGALMAGVSIDLFGSRGHYVGSTKDDVGYAPGRAVKLDLGYRFLHLGEAATGPVRYLDGSRASPDPDVESIRAHEFRVGLRIDLR